MQNAIQNRVYFGTYKFSLNFNLKPSNNKNVCFSEVEDVQTLW